MTYEELGVSRPQECVYGCPSWWLNGECACWAAFRASTTAGGRLLSCAHRPSKRVTPVELCHIQEKKETGYRYANSCKGVSRTLVKQGNNQNKTKSHTFPLKSKELSQSDSVFDTSADHNSDNGSIE